MKTFFISLFALLFITQCFAQTTLSTEDCEVFYQNAFYAEILPSLRQMRKDLEKDENFDAEKYTSTIVQLSMISTHYDSDVFLSAKYLEKALATLIEKTQNSKYTRLIATMLAENYIVLRLFSMAEDCIEKTEKLFVESKDYGDGYLMFLTEKIRLYFAVGNNEKLLAVIESLIKNYNRLYGNIFESKDFKALSMLATVAKVYKKLDEVSKSETCYNHIIKTLENHHDVTETSLFNEACSALAVIKMQQHSWSESMDLFSRIIGSYDYNNFTYCKNILTLGLFLGQNDTIAKYYANFSGYLQQFLPRIFFKTTEENRYNIWLENAEDIEFYNFAALKTNLSSVKKDAFVSTVFFKTLSLKSGKMLDDFISNSVDNNLKNAYKKCQDLKQKFIFRKGSFEDYYEYERLFDSVLTKSSKLSQKILNQLKKFTDSKDALIDNEYAVEFCLIPDYENYPNHCDYFGAYVINRNFSVPRLVKLAKIQDVENLLKRASDDQLFYTEFYSNHKINDIYKLIFKPLEPYLKNAKTVFYSPYGILSQLNFDLFIDDNGVPLNQKYKMVRVSSTANILSVKFRNIIAVKTAVFYDNINYDSSFYETSRGYIFGRLTNAGEEARIISNLLKSHNITSTLYEDKFATEQSFKNLSGNSPEIIHLATHGFCFDTDEKVSQRPFAQSINSSTPKESAMALSGLALSGANNAWKGNFNTSDTEDGILTAYEISQLDLSNTKLVVLSACETARGKIFPVDGVFGLQRAFKQAGAGAILMSLWKVDDGVTAIFMEYFYKFLFETSDRHKALKMAQDEVKKQYPDAYYWAAWVMLD